MRVRPSVWPGQRAVHAMASYKTRARAAVVLIRVYLSYGSMRRAQHNSLRDAAIVKLCFTRWRFVRFGT